MNWQHDLKQSTHTVLTIWPKIKDELGGGELIAVEGDNSQIARMLDTCSGIDFIQAMPDGGLRSLATRVSFGTKNWATFTIRYSRPSENITEYHKRCRDLLHSYLSPHLTLQAYFEPQTQKLLSCAAIKTLDLYKHIKQNARDYKLLSSKSGERFISVPFSDVKSSLLLHV